LHYRNRSGDQKHRNYEEKYYDFLHAQSFLEPLSDRQARQTLAFGAIFSTLAASIVWTLPELRRLYRGVGLSARLRGTAAGFAFD
jgi:hypothetical protein